MRSLGVGLSYLLEFDTLFRETTPGLCVLELEPQEFWVKSYQGETGGAPRYTPSAELIARVASLPQHKLVHSVAMPFSGVVSLEGDQVTPLGEVVRALNAAWASEHLSFNVFENNGEACQAGFLLPPRQTDAGVDLAVRNIRRLASRLPVPVAFETGVNYLQPRPDEMPDGEFFAAIAEGADCGIVLDLHNLWANQRNGRQSIERVLDTLPLERVWEIHLAGGVMLDGYYIDGHSGAVSPQLWDIAQIVVPQLPNLGAIIFEILPSYVQLLGLNGAREQIAQLVELWSARPPRSVAVPRRLTAFANSGSSPHDLAAWEKDLALRALGHKSAADGDAMGLGSDRGVTILRKLIDEARYSRLARAVRYTMTLLLVHLGPTAVRELLAHYGASSFPDVFAAGEADRFASYLKERIVGLSHIPHLSEVLAFEHALVRASLYGASSRIEWTVDPAELLGALDEGRIPSLSLGVPSVMNVVAES